MKNILLISTVILFSFNSFGQTKRMPPMAQTDSITNNKRITVNGEIVDGNIMEVISNPEKYEGKTIRIKGYLNLKFEGTALYASSEDYDKRIYANSIFLNVQSVHKIKNEKKFATVVGTFTSKSKGHMGMFGGLLFEVFKIDY